MNRSVSFGGRGGAGLLFGQLAANQHYVQGLQIAEQGDWGAALDEYRQACIADPTNTTYQLARGHLCQAHGLLDEATEAYEAALEVAPSNVVVLNNQALLFAQQGDLARARTNFERILLVARELGERAAPVCAGLGDLALREERYAQAAKHFQQALRYDPTHAYSRAALAAIPRLREFSHPIGRDGSIAVKPGVYAFAGAIALGLPPDDGIELPRRARHTFGNLAEVGDALRRFLDLAAAWQWRFDAVVPLEGSSRPLAQALAVTLDSVCVAEPPYLHGGGVLAVAGCVQAAVAYGDAVAAVRERTESALVYVLGAEPALWDITPPHVLHVPAPVAFPWSAGEAAAAEHAEALGEALASAVRVAPPDLTIPDQVAWYHRHRALRLNPARFRTGRRSLVRR